MWRISLASLRLRPGRFIGTALAIIVATGFLATALIARDSLGSALRDNASGQLEGVDAAVRGVELEEDSASTNAESGVTVVFAGERPAGPAAIQSTVESVSEVGEAAGTVEGSVDILGEDGQAVEESIGGRAWISVDALNPFDVVEGAAPAAEGEVALDRGTTDELDLAIGDDVTLATGDGTQTARLVAITTFGDVDASSPSGDLLVTDDDAFAWFAAGREEFDTILVSSPDGDQEQLVAALAAEVGGDLEVVSGDELRDEAGSASAEIANQLGTGLQAFAYIALFVGVFIIYNTFSVTVAQRLKEFALLRAVGASDKQVARTVRLEALAIGLVASLGGILVGLALMGALLAFVPAVKDFAGSAPVSLRLGLTSVIQVLLVGLVVTVLSAWVPARRAGRTRPIEALRESAVDEASSHRTRGLVGGVMAGVGAVALVAGSMLTVMPMLVGGPVLLIVGVLVAGPGLASAYATVVGRPLRKVGGVSTDLAVENVTRNPLRTATTANALVIGVFLVVFITTAGGAVGDWAVEQLASLSGADLTVQADSGRLPDEVVDGASQVDGVVEVVALRGDVGALEIGGVVASTDLKAATDHLGLGLTEGSIDLSNDQVVVSDIVEVSVGDDLTVLFADGSSRDLEVIGRTGFSLDIAADAFISPELADEVDPGGSPTMLAITVEEGTAESVDEDLETLVASYSTVTVVPGNFFAEIVGSLFDFMITAVNMLLGVAVLIAVFGIVNTLVLSLSERYHEIGVLRAIGMSKRQLRSEIRIEAILVSVLGTLTGVILGLFVAWGVTRPIFGGASWPVGPVAIILVGGVLIGVLASLIPARLASRLKPVEAMRYE
jgi:putative ABC transport system permease protein